MTDIADALHAGLTQMREFKIEVPIERLATIESGILTRVRARFDRERWNDQPHTGFVSRGMLDPDVQTFTGIAPQWYVTLTIALARGELTHKLLDQLGFPPSDHHNHTHTSLIQGQTGKAN